MYLRVFSSSTIDFSQTIYSLGSKNHQVLVAPAVSFVISKEPIPIDFNKCFFNRNPPLH